MRGECALDQSFTGCNIDVEAEGGGASAFEPGRQLASRVKSEYINIPLSPGAELSSVLVRQMGAMIIHSTVAPMTTSMTMPTATTIAAATPSKMATTTTIAMVMPLEMTMATHLMMSMVMVIATIMPPGMSLMMPITAIITMSIAIAVATTTPLTTSMQLDPMSAAMSTITARAMTIPLPTSIATAVATFMATAMAIAMNMVDKSIAAPQSTAILRGVERWG